ncbi:MAG: hypothetical protein SFX74_07435 [Fimbriimonadaceae bacterium]|nr:hypothetical protein [Fimbriimonadaceae bacterium]
MNARWSNLLYCLALLGLFGWVVSMRSTAAFLLEDSDTRVLLLKIREVQNPWHWFTHDWPLENHFYRPISTVMFEFDNWRYGNDPAGYGLTNAVVAALNVVLLAWFVCELTGRRWMALTAGALFAVWLGGYEGGLSQLGTWLALFTLVAGVIRHGVNVRAYGLTALGWWSWSGLVLSIVPLWGRNIGWIPGRTATVMTVFALISLAAYARFERLSADARPARHEPGPLDPPATRNTAVRPRRAGGFWLVIAYLGLALALGSYEQAVMLPAVWVGVGLTLYWSGLRVRPLAHVTPWLLLVGYLVLRRAILPPQVSGYQDQQLRFGSGVEISLLEFAFPGLSGFHVVGIVLSEMPYILLTSQPYQMVLGILADLGAFLSARRAWIVALAGYGMSFLAFLPMAWLNMFEHYYFWPMAMRSLLVIGLGTALASGTLTAACRPSIQAPARLRPAPGSLPRP